MSTAGARWANAAAAVRGANGWPHCAGGCGWPLDPAAEAGGHDRHPGCEPRPRISQPQRVARHARQERRVA